MRITYFALMVFYGVSGALWLGVLWLGVAQAAVIHNSDMIVAWCLAFALVISLVIYFARYFVLTDEGIHHKLFGICYRTTPWDRIYKIKRISNRFKQDKDPTFVVCVLGKDEDRIEAELQPKRRKGICGWLGEERFSIYCHWRKEKNMLSYIDAHCKSVKYEHLRWTGSRYIHLDLFL